MRRVRLAGVTLITLSMLLTACGGGDEDEKSDGPEDQATTPGKTLPSAWPLTGLPVKGDAQVAKQHPVYTVKIDNSSSSAPQAGLGKADLVVEELVEGGMTRLAAFYYSTLPKVVGPVRSMRASDIGIVTPADATIVTSGAAQVTIDRLREAKVKYIEEGAKGIYRDDARSAPYNLFANLPDVAATAKQADKVPADYLPWGKKSDLPTGQPAKTLAASFSGSQTTTWSFQGGKYHNDNSNAAEGDQFVADTVLVLRVKVGDAGYTDPAGNPVPETDFQGLGQAMLFHGGKLVRGTWSKKGHTGALTLKTKAGALKVPAGHTWIELVPVDGGDVTFGK